MVAANAQGRSGPNGRIGSGDGQDSNDGHKVPGEAICVERQAPGLGAPGKHDSGKDGEVALNAPMFKEYLRFICNRRSQQIGLEPLFEGVSNPFPWMAEMIDLKKERNFFETRVIEYQTGGALSWD